MQGVHVSPTDSSDAGLSAPDLAGDPDQCPLCDQLIPPDRHEEIKQQIHSRQVAQAAALTARIEAQFTREKAELIAHARAEREQALAAVRNDADQRVRAARDEERLKLDTEVEARLATVNEQHRQAEETWRAQITQAQSDAKAAADTGADLRLELEQTRRDHGATLEEMRKSAVEREAAIERRANESVEARVQQRNAQYERSHAEADAQLRAQLSQTEADKAAALTAGQQLKEQLESERAAADTNLSNTRREAEQRQAEAVLAAVASTQLTMQERLDAAEQARNAADLRVAGTDAQLQAIQVTHAQELDQRLTEQREALEQDKANALNAAKSGFFDERAHLLSKVEELQRSLDKKTADDLGEGAEIDLFELLKTECPNDRIERVPHGLNGADVVQVVVHNGKDCGKILYDSKNHNAWRYEFVTKLASDQLSEGADHAILSTRSFPKDTRQLHVHNGVIIVHPARVAALVQIVRQHIIATHTLRLSNEARKQKTAALYSFITSAQCHDLLTRIDTHSEGLLELQVKDKRAHDLMWKNQGELIRSIQRVRGEICNQIDMIIGTSEGSSQAASL